MARLTDIDGLEPAHAQALAEAGVTSVALLLERAGTRKGRKRLAGVAGVGKRDLRSWVEQADLFRIEGVAGRYARLLHAAGATTVGELAARKAGKLRRQAERVNETAALVRRVPPKPVLAAWITQARSLPPAVD